VLHVGMALCLTSMTIVKATNPEPSAPPAQIFCEDQFQALRNDANTDATPERQLDRWKALKPKCDGNATYQLRLGGFNVEAGHLDEARIAFESGLKLGGSEKELRLGLSDVEFRQGHLEAAWALASGLIDAHPDWAPGYSAAAQVQLVRHQFDEAIHNLEHANTLTPGSGAFQLLAMAYYQQRRPREAAAAMQRALKLDRSALKNTQAVCATAFSLVQLGHVPEADQLLKRHVLLRPSAADVPQFKEATTLVGHRLESRAP